MSDAHPFHELLPKQAQSLRRRALKLTSNQHRAEDLVQATLLKAWTSRDSFKPETNLRAWLFTILRNTFFSEIRKYRREVEDVDGTRAESLFEEPRQEHAVALKELLAVIARLPQDQRRPLVLMGILGFSQLQAAHACGCTVGTIKSRVSRSRAALERLMAQDDLARVSRSSPATAILRPNGVRPNAVAPPGFAVAKTSAVRAERV